MEITTSFEIITSLPAKAPPLNLDDMLQKEMQLSLTLPNFNNVSLVMQ